MINQVRKIRQNILQQATGSRTFKHRIYPVKSHNPAAHETNRKKFYRTIAGYGKAMRRN